MAQQAQGLPAQAPAPASGGRLISVPDGKGGQMLITLDGAGGNVTVDRNGTETGISTGRSDKEIPSGVVDIMQSLAVMIAFIVVGGPLARAWARRIEHRESTAQRGAPALNTEVARRLASIEASVEAVAVEVERISEGQRFTMKLLSERAKVEVERM